MAIMGHFNRPIDFHEGKPFRMTNAAEHKSSSCLLATSNIGTLLIASSMLVPARGGDGGGDKQVYTVTKQRILVITN